MSYKIYGEYQTVDNVFFNQIPKNWSLFKLKFLINSLESGKRKDFEFEDYAFSLGGEHINWNGTLNLKNERYISKEFYNSMNKGKVQENDTLLVKDGATIGKTAFVNNLTQKMAVNEHVFILRNNYRLIPKILYYLISSNLGFVQIKLTETGSAQGGISQDIADNVSFVIPESLQEQKQIANYLDKQTSQIDETIAKNEKLIKLLEEKRVALINQVVTKDLNPNAPMKDSGVEWIGEIPEHWRVVKLKFCTNIINDKKDFADKDDKYVGLEHIESETGKLLSYSDEGADGTVNKFKKNMVLFGKLRPYLAKVINPSFEGVCSTELLVFKTNEMLMSKYLFYFMLSNRFIEQVNSSTYGVKMPRASLEFINSLPITIPNTSEQKEIVFYLNNETLKINQTITKIKENITLLEEYKTSLIHHVVTGKIDVRGEEI